MSSTVPPNRELRSGDWLRLPLPVRGARYILGSLLALVIVAVVLTTYQRIEHQLEATLRDRLTTVLHQHVSATFNFVEDTKKTTNKATEIILEHFDHAQGSEAHLELDEILQPWLELGTVNEIYFVDAKEGATLFSLPSRATLSGKVIAALGPGPGTKTMVSFEHLAKRQRIYAFRRVQGTDRVVVVAIAPSELVRRLNPTQTEGSTHSYAFDRAGWLTAEEGGIKRRDRTREGFPKELTKRTRAKTKFSPQVGEYLGRKGDRVIGAWVWLPEYHIGITTEVLRHQARTGIERLRSSFLVLATLVATALLGFLALGRWTLRVRQESLLMTRRLSRLSRTIQPLSAALEHDPSAVLLVDQDGTVIYANAASHRVLGVHAPLIGQDADAVFETLDKELQSALASGQDSIVARGGETDGETLLVSSHSLTIEGTSHFLYMLRPVTQQVRRQEVEHWKKLIRVLSHELNNALAPITSLLSSARKVNQMTHQDPRLGQIFESISERTAHLVSFLEGYREVARLPRPAPRSVDWKVFLRSIESQKKFKQVGELPEAPGYFDPIQLERVIVNLINNALEAESSRGDIEIEVLEEETRFRIDVMDRGTGMPEAVLKQAMLPFFSTKRTGTGVGLALSREIIEAHDGQLSLANREGGGLIVSCSLPKAAPIQRTSLGRIATATPVRKDASSD